MNMSRRNLLVGGIASVGLTARSWSRIARGDNPSNRVRVGVIGTGVRGKYLIGNLPSVARVEAICDCATSRMTDTLQPKAEFKKVLATFQTEQAQHCATFQDYRQLFDKTQLDAVIIATPDHHHVPAALLALQAGLDVYLEKPLTLTIREGRVLADAVKKSGRILQVGSQQRTMEINRFACEFIRDGGLGKITHVHVPNYPGPMSVPDYPEEPLPPGLDWKLFLGQAPARPHNKLLWVKDDFKVGDLLWRGWDLFKDYSGHLVTNWGGHHIDMVQYALGMDHTGPTQIIPTHDFADAELALDWQKNWSSKTPPPVGSFSDDSRFTPIQLTYPGGIEMSLRPGTETAMFYGERGVMSVSRNKFSCMPRELVKNAPEESVGRIWDGEGHVARPHLQNWLDCIVSRQTPNAPVEVGHRTATVCHLINISRQLRRPLKWNPITEEFADDAAASALLERPVVT